MSLLATLLQGRCVSLQIVTSDVGDSAAKLRPEIEVQREVAGAWQSARVEGLLIRHNCDEHPDGCVTIPPRTIVTVPEWMGMIGDGQCMCERCYNAPPGRYRFVVTHCSSCPSQTQVISAPVTLRHPAHS